jgi:hypothetical protein
MDERTFHSQLAALLEGIGYLPEPSRVALARHMGGEALSTAQLAHQLGQVTDVLRLGLTYQVFDLEATRRENRYLRRILEDQATARSEHLDEDVDGESFFPEQGEGNEDP